MEKYTLDSEMLQMFAEVFQPMQSDDSALAFEAIASVEPGGHFFDCEHTMSRYQTAFYQPLVSDWRVTTAPGRKVAAKPPPNAPIVSGKKS